MPLEGISEADLQYYLLVFDAAGRERCSDPDSPDGVLSHRLLDDLRSGPITDVFILAHGWKADIPAAREQYGRWIRAMAACSADRARMRTTRKGFQAMIIGLHWPSLPWGDEEIARTSSSFTLAAGIGATDAEINACIESYAERIADTPEARAALATIFRAAAANSAPAQLPPEVGAAYRVLDAQACLGSAGPAGRPGSDREAFDPENAYRIALATTQLSYGAGTSAGLLAPLRQLSFWKMKDRARSFGEHGAFELLCALEQAKPTARIHIVGHSFGCIVASAMICGPSGRGELPHPVDSLALVQGALSLWSYCPDIPVVPGRAGYFHPLVGQGKVRGAIITTQSARDTALGVFYPTAAGVAGQIAYAPGELPTYGAIGTFGIQGLAQKVIGGRMQDVDGKLEFRPGVIYNLDSTEYIREGSGASGAHSDIAKPQIAHAIWEAARQCGP